jgi:uncharacterized protein YaaR (DUF327 family)
MRVRDRVDGKKGVSLDRHGVSRPVGSVSSAKETEFSETLKVTKTEAVKGELSELMEALDKQALLLRDSRSLATIRRYRELVQSFLKTAVDESFELSEERAFDRRGRRRVFLLVKQVNKAVEELTRMVLEQQADPLSLLEKMGEIRGLLIDLYT